MAFIIRHDVPFAASAGLAALAGTAETAIRDREEQRVRGRQAQQLDAAAQRQQAQIRAQAEGQQRQIEAASVQAQQSAELTKDRIAFSAGLQEELQEQKFGQEMEGMKQRAESDAQQWEWKLDTTAKRKQGEYKRVLSQLNDAEAMSEAGFSEGEVAQLKQQVWAGLNSVEFTPSMRDPQWDDNLSDGQGNQVQAMESFKTVHGGYAHYELSARGTPTLKHELKPSETIEYLQLEAEQEREKAQTGRMQSRRDEADRYARDLETKLKETWEGSVLAEKRSYTPTEIKNMRARAFPDIAEEEEAVAREQRESTTFLYNTRFIDVSEADADLTLEQQKAQGVIRKALRLKKAGRNISGMLPLIQEAQEILKASRRGVQ